MESRTVDVEGIRMRWEEEGEGHPVVFIHGIPTSPRLWRRDGTWEWLLAHAQTKSDVVGEVDWTVSVDSTVARAHQHATGTRRRPGQDDAKRG